jgi:hypothetical protein
MIPLIQCDDTDDFGVVLYDRWLELSAQGHPGEELVRHSCGLIVEINAGSEPNLLIGKASALLQEHGPERFKGSWTIIVHADGTHHPSSLPVARRAPAYY